MTFEGELSVGPYHRFNEAVVKGFESLFQIRRSRRNFLRTVPQQISAHRFRKPPLYKIGHFHAQSGEAKRVNQQKKNILLDLPLPCQPP